MSTTCVSYAGNAFRTKILHYNNVYSSNNVYYFVKIEIYKIIEAYESNITIHVARATKIPITYYVLLNFSGFVKLISFVNRYSYLQLYSMRYN